MEFSRRLPDYVNRLHAAGKNYTQIVVALAIELGYALPIAHRIVEAVFSHSGNGHKLFFLAPGEEQPLPEIDTSHQRTNIDLGDIFPEVVFEQLAPRVVLLDGFMTDAECDEICELAGPLMCRSRVMNEQAGGSIVETEVRDANTAFLLKENSIPLVDIIERRINALTKWPIAQGEPLQVQRYRPNGKYIPHYDFFGKQTKGIAESGGQRIATLIVYLKAPDAGGATYLANLGIRIQPRKGSALFFVYPEASPQSGTLHGGDPVLSGEKWILTKWFRERDYVPKENKNVAPADYREKETQ